MRNWLRFAGWVLLIPSVGYFAIQLALLADNLVGGGTTTWNIPQIITFAVIGLVGEGLREYSKQNKEAKNNAK